jgi:hypothetical protein
MERRAIGSGATQVVRVGGGDVRHLVTATLKVPGGTLHCLKFDGIADGGRIGDPLTGWVHRGGFRRDGRSRVPTPCGPAVCKGMGRVRVAAGIVRWMAGSGSALFRSHLRKWRWRRERRIDRPGEVRAEDRRPRPARNRPHPHRAEWMQASHLPDRIYP